MTEQPDNKPGLLQMANNTFRAGENPVHFFAGAAGFVIATGVALISGVPVAWATPMYFTFGWPLMCVVIYLLARAYPVRAWRWTLSMMLGQVFSSIFFGGGALLPVAMVYVTLLSVPQFYVGSLGSRAGMRRLASTQPAEAPADGHNARESSAGGDGYAGAAAPDLHKTHSENTDSQDRI